MQIKRSVVFLLLALSAAILTELNAKLVFAEDEINITILDSSVEMSVFPGMFGEETQTITASTTNTAGYTIGIRTTGTSSALVNIQNSNYTVPTFTLPSGTDSIPVSQLGYGYGYSTDSGANYLPVPEPTASQATTLFKTTTAGTNTHNLTFGVKVPPATAAGTYTNTFLIEIVANLEPCAQEKICYYGNEDDGTGTMDDQVVQSNTNVDLIPSNFSRPGYGFAGWNTKMDGTGTSYGPGETINTGNLQQEGLQLYAKWVQSTENMQAWDGCSLMNIGDITALTDVRDGNTYAVAKYADGQCWMMENLRLELSNPNLTINDTNTNKPSANFINQANQHPASSNDFCTKTTQACIDSLYYNANNIDRNLTASYNANDNSSSWYSYGVSYNWYTATAGNGTYEISTQGAMTRGDLCPAGWHLPNGSGLNGDLAKLDIALHGDGRNKTNNPEVSERWRKYPINHIYSGEFRGTAGYNRGLSAGVAAGNAYSATNAMNLWIRPVGVSMNSNSTVRNRGQTIRCIVNGSYDVTGNIRYNANGGTGTMVDDTDVDFEIATARANEFTKSHAAFASWNTKPDGTGTPVAAGGSVATAAHEEGIEEGDTLILYAIWSPIYTISYDGNGSTAGTMAMVHAEGEKNLTMTPPNFSKNGYGFAGWSADNDAASKLIAGTSVTIYGPNQRITIDSNLASHADANNNITLYAVWIQTDPVKTMQTFGTSECTNLSSGQIVALTDTRNGETYSVAKLGDGHCWMLENLKLDPSTTQFDATNTNSPTTDFITKAATSSSSRTLCGADNSTCVDQPQYNLDNIDLSLTSSESSLVPGHSWYSYGGMYNWYTASAGNGDHAMNSGSVVGDICPYGWRLPTGGNGGEYAALNSAIGGTLNNDEPLRRYPNNFIYSGDFNQTAPGGRSTFGRYWSATAENENKSFRLGFTGSAVTPVGSWNKWDAFAIRCIVK